MGAEPATCEVIEPGDHQALALVASRLLSKDWQQLDALEDAMDKHPDQRQLPLRHLFTPGLYIREIFMPAGTLLTSRIHLRTHPFVISKGVVSVWDTEAGWVTYAAAHTGITKAGTRRLLYIHEDTIWTTFHVTDKTDPDEIVREISYSSGKYEDLRGAAAGAQPTLKETHS